MSTRMESFGRDVGILLILSVHFCAAGITHAQPQKLVVRILYPPRNYEIRLGDTITPRVRVRNMDTTPSAAVTLHYRIRNVVTGITTYTDSLTLPSVAPGDSMDEKFNPYVTNKNILSQLGTFNACLTIAPGDSICTRLFGVRRTTQPYRDASNNYSKTFFADIPDQTLWISEGATVVDGEDSTWDPPPPRDLSAAGYGPDSMHSPVMRLDRMDETGKFYSGDGVGDTLMSFPINLMGQTRVSLTFDFMRSGRHRYPLNWDANTMLGPEQTITDGFGRVIRPGDSLVIEFKKPGEPGTDPSPDGWDEIAAIDGGHDFEFKPFYTYLYSNQDTTSLRINLDGVSKTTVNVPHYFTPDFRIRFRLRANNDAPQTAPPSDDADAWYIDNPTLQVPKHPELDVRWVRVVNPYTKIPLSQANFPIFVSVRNQTTDIAWNVPLHVAILDSYGDTVYSQRVMLTDLGAGVDSSVKFPNWDASGEGAKPSNKYIVSAAIDQPCYDEYEDDNETYTKFFLNVEFGDQSFSEFALDHAGLTPSPGGGNDMPTYFKIAGAGIGFFNTTGSFAMKFQLARKDTVYGVRVYFGNANQAPDYIRISLLRGDSTSCIPLDTVYQPWGQSSFQDQRRGTYFNQFWPYYFPNVIVLPKGIYWVAVSQLAKNNMCLGGDFSRGGGEILRADNSVPEIRSIYGPASAVTPWYGTQWGSGPADNNGDVSCSFAMETPAGSGLWQPMMPGYGWWPAMTPANQMQPLLHPNNIMSNLDVPPWTGAGTFMPMIRPLISNAVWSPPRRIVAAASVLPTLALESIYPNPFDPAASETTIAYVLQSPGSTSLTVCNMLGCVVRTLVNSTMSDGTHSVSWDGNGDNGTPVPAGPYLLSLSSGGQRSTAKLIVAY